MEEKTPRNLKTGALNHLLTSFVVDKRTQNLVAEVVAIYVYFSQRQILIVYVIRLMSISFIFLLSSFPDC